MKLEARTLKKYLVKRPKARFWEFEGSCVRENNVKTEKTNICNQIKQKCAKIRF